MNITSLTLTGPNGDAVTLGTLTHVSGQASGYTLTQATLDPAERVVGFSNLPLVPGGLVTPGRLSYREIQLRGTIVASTAVGARALLQQLVAVTADRGPDPVVVRYNNGEANVQVSAYLSGSVTAEAIGGPYLDYSLTLVAPDPVAYSQTQTTVALGAAAANAGNATVYPIITVSQSGGDLTLTSSTTGQTMAFTGLPSGTLTIDCRPGYENAKVGSTPVLNKLSDSSRFLSIPAGGTTISGGSGTVTYRAGWLA